MNKIKMTIHRALSELKLIDARITKAINQMNPTGLMKIDKPVNGFVSKEEFEKDVKSKYQSVSDLIERKIKIKSKIIEANSKTIVKVAGKEMTIADAINYKSIISNKQDLINRLNLNHNSIKAKFIQENEHVNRIALDNAKIMLGKQGDDKVKPTDNDVKNIVEPYVKRNEFHLVDPLNVEKLIEQLQSEVDDFEAEIDAVLSEINAITIIEI